MRQFLRQSGKQHTRHHSVGRKHSLGMENLEERRLMAHMGYPAPDDDGPWGPIGPVVHESLITETEPDPQPWQPAEVFDIGARISPGAMTPIHEEVVQSLGGVPGGAGQPAPDDDGPWGPLGPLVREAAIAQLATRLGEGAQSPVGTIAMMQHGYPSDDDIGPWGPIGPVIHEILPQTVDAALSEHVVPAETAGSMVGALGDAGLPAPDDDDDWGPLGPVVRDVALLVTNPEPQPWLPSGAVLPAIESAAPAGGLGDQGLPADDDDGPWGPIGPVIHDGLRDFAHNAADAASYRTATRA